jgi:hypothetical protein
VDVSILGVRGIKFYSFDLVMLRLLMGPIGFASQRQGRLSELHDPRESFQGNGRSNGSNI